MSRASRLRKRNTELNKGSSNALVQDSSTEARRARTLCAAVCCCIAVLSFLPALWFGFVYDDHSQIVQNPQIQSWDNLGRLLSSDLWSQKGPEHLGTYYRPAFSVWLLIVHTIAGLTPWLWHLSNVLLHAVVTYGVFRLSLELFSSLRGACVATTLFAVHPIHGETVAWVSAGNELLLGGFLIFSLLLFVHSDRADPWNSSSFWISLLLWGAALLSKETAIALAPIWLLWVLSRRRKDSPIRESLVKALPACGSFLLLAVVYLGLRFIVIHRTGFEIQRHSWTQVACTGFSLVPFYLRKLILPLGLSPFYDNPVLASLQLDSWVGMVLLLICGTLLVWLAVKRKAGAATSMAFLLLPLVPALVGVRIFRDGDLAHDRYLYLPSVGLCLAIGLIFDLAWARTKTGRLVSTTLGLVAFAILFAQNLTQEAHYANDQGFDLRALEVVPNNALVRGLLGDLYLGQGKNEMALAQFQEAYRLSPSGPEVQYRLARGLFELKRYAEAEPHLRQLALAHDPAVSTQRRGILLLSWAQAEIHLGRLPEARSVLDSMEPDYDGLAGLHQTSGALYEREGRLDDAVREYQRAFEVSRDQRFRRRAIELQRVIDTPNTAPQNRKPL